MHETNSRCILHKSKLSPFKEFLESEGWELVPSKGDYEVLRMTRGNILLLVYRKDEVKEHYTTHGEALKQVKRWLRSKR